MRSDDRSTARPASKTLGDVLYADRRAARVPENYWTRLVNSMAAGDPLALHALYAQTHRFVFTLLMRLTGHRETAEELTVEAFARVWQRAAGYDPAEGSVLAWIMNEARSRALDHLKRTNRSAREASRLLKRALTDLSSQEREAIEATFFSERTTPSTSAAKTRIRTGLEKIRKSLTGSRRSKSRPGDHSRDHAESVCLYSLQALAAGERIAVEAQIAACPQCRRDAESLRPILDTFAYWPAPVLRPPASLWDRLSRRIGEKIEEPPRPAPQAWEEPAPGIFCKLLATDLDKGQVSMLVRLAPGTDYPPHVHAGVEELHMLEGELIVNDKKLEAGDYLRSEPGSADHRVWSRTGCTGVLITSTRDMLR